MKHNLKVIAIMTVLFLIAQFIGLYVADFYSFKDLPYNIQKPKFEEKTSYVSVFLAILFATFLASILIKFNAEKLWKFWFFLSIWFALSISFSAFIRQEIAIILALVISIFRVVKHNLIVHNFSEVFIYGGLAALFSQSLSIFSISILLILISIYDMIAVWKTKHMIKLAEFQTRLKLFAGFLISYKDKKKVKTAILGGGDIGFPLLFAASVFDVYGFKAILIPIATSLLLIMIFLFGENNKFYPAMPFLSIGCFLGYLLVLITA